MTWPVLAAMLGLLAMLLVAHSVAAQSNERPDGDGSEGFRLTYGPSLAKPLLDERGRAPFAAIGDFRTGLGIQVGAGYQIRRWEVTATVDAAGPEVGEPFERNGIPMGRESSILWAFNFQLWWNPPGLSLGSWRPSIGGGYVRSGLDNVMLRPDQLSGSLEASARTVEAGDQAHSTGIAGSGFRLGVGVERNFTGSLALRSQLTADFLRYGRFIYGDGEFPWAGGTGWVPRLSAVVRWVP